MVSLRQARRCWRWVVVVAMLLADSCNICSDALMPFDNFTPRDKDAHLRTLTRTLTLTLLTLTLTLTPTPTLTLAVVRRRAISPLRAASTTAAVAARANEGGGTPRARATTETDSLGPLPLHRLGDWALFLYTQPECIRKSRWFVAVGRRVPGSPPSQALGGRRGRERGSATVCRPRGKRQFR